MITAAAETANPGFYPANSSSGGIADGGGIWRACGARALDCKRY